MFTAPTDDEIVFAKLRGVQLALSTCFVGQRVIHLNSVGEIMDIRDDQSLSNFYYKWAVILWHVNPPSDKFLLQNVLLSTTFDLDIYVVDLR